MGVCLSYCLFLGGFFGFLLGLGGGFGVGGVGFALHLFDGRKELGLLLRGELGGVGVSFAPGGEALRLKAVFFAQLAEAGVYGFRRYVFPRDVERAVEKLSDCPDAVRLGVGGLCDVALAVVLVVFDHLLKQESRQAHAVVGYRADVYGERGAQHSFFQRRCGGVGVWVSAAEAALDHLFGGGYLVVRADMGGFLVSQLRRVGAPEDFFGVQYVV